MSLVDIQQVIKIAHQAGDILLSYHKKEVKIHKKSDNSPVTEADLASSQFVCEQLQQLTPNLPILSEESKNITFQQRQPWQRYWLIDPLDGTKQFILGQDYFSILIALVEQGRPSLGVIYIPTLQETFYAIKNQGAFYQRPNGQVEKLFQKAPHFIENQQQVRPIKIAIGSASNKKQTHQVFNQSWNYEYHILASSGIKAAYVARGDFDCYARIGKTGEWDTAAGEILITESGGKVFAQHFEKLSYNQRESLINPPFIMVANKQANWRDIINNF